MKVTKTSIPQNSLLQQTGHYDYEDSYSMVLADEKNEITLNTVTAAFMTSAPVWIKFLMHVRDAVVTPLGLKTGKALEKDSSKILELKPGSRAGIFKILDLTENEIIAGENDRHLNFKVSLWLNPIASVKNEKEIVISTVVHFNNWLGRLYFLPVKPIHRIIVPTMMKQMAKNLQPAIRVS
jgi:hypothetical protein